MSTLYNLWFRIQLKKVVSSSRSDAITLTFEMFKYTRKPFCISWYDWKSTLGMYIYPLWHITSLVYNARSVNNYKIETPFRRSVFRELRAIVAFFVFFIHDKNLPCSSVQKVMVLNQKNAKDLVVGCVASALKSCRSSWWRKIQLCKVLRQ